jgi:hypothetical protein
MTKEERYARFTEDLETAGFEVQPDYHGRNFYKGPAVKCDKSEWQDVVRATDLKLQWDELGLGWVVYPV